MSANPPGPTLRSALPAQIRRARRRQAGLSEPPHPPRPRRRGHSGAMPDPAVLARAIEALFAGQGWRPQPFQRALWQAAADGDGGLLHADTGAGKTWAAWAAALLRAAARPHRGTRVLWLTPMRALARDTVRALQAPLAALGIDWAVALRTADTPSAERQHQRRQPPQALVTTPESLSLMLCDADANERLGALAMVVADEWHELLGNKRGVQLQLALARLRRWNPGLVVWGLSATLADPATACRCLVGDGGRLIAGAPESSVRIDTLLPARVERFPWAGHLGLAMLPAVLAELDASPSALVFTNTRAQSEQWYQAILAARPEWAGTIAVHHGSLDAEVRAWVEDGIRDGRLRAVVCTASLDLGVDFLPVERVLQIGSPKGVARLLQRAGRSGHAPGRQSRVSCVPTHALELLEAAAARQAAADGRIEPRRSPAAPLDVLVQHLVTLALGDGFDPDALWPEIRSCAAYRDLDPDDWRWALAFVVDGGAALGAYPEYCRVAVGEDGRYRVRDGRIARRHRLSIGTITADAEMRVSFADGGRLGSIEEGFIARLRPGDQFVFAGRHLELLRVREMTAYVRLARRRGSTVPRWTGGRMPLSSTVADAMLSLLEAVAAGHDDTPETRLLAPLLALQGRWSRLPGHDRLLIETTRSREGHHAFFYPFAGRHAHAGLAALVAWRVARSRPITFSMAVNDYGFELLSAEPVDWQAQLADGLLDAAGARDDLVAGLNATELARRAFREIARVAGLVFQGYPGAAKGARQLQAGSGLLYDVFARYDPDNRLLRQARDEALARELDIGRLEAGLRRLATRPPLLLDTPRPTPFAFPLMIERLRERMSSERLAARIARMIGQLERAADAPPRKPPRP